MEQLLTDVFRNINRQQIKYCLLRGADELSLNFKKKEIDLLVRPDHLVDFGQTVKKHGFIALPSWGHAPHHFYLAFDKSSDTWIKLDVVTKFAYGRPFKYLHLAVADSFLESRINLETLFALSPQHEFYTLFLHCMLDKGYFASKHRRRLKQLLILVNDNKTLSSEVESLFDDYFSEQPSWDRVRQLITNDRWEDILCIEKSVRRKLFQHQSARNAGLYLRNRLLRRLRPIYFALYRHGISIVLLAPDGGGKSTLAKSLVDESIFRARLIYMGSNVDAANVSLPTTRFFKNLIKSTDDENTLVIKPLKTLGYVNRLLEQWLRITVGMYHKSLGRFLVFDRYVYDGYLAPPTQSFFKKLRRSLLMKSCIQPDLIFFLDAPGDVLYKRKGEHSPEILENQRQKFLSLRDRLPNMRIIDATKSADQIRSEVIDIIWSHYAAITG